MKKYPRITKLVVIVAILFTVMTLWAGGGFTVPDLVGQWNGKSRFSGISYEEATQKKVAPQDVNTVLHISADGKVMGQIGGAELSGCVIKAHRGLFWKLIRMKTNFIIEGQIVGAIAPGSANGTNSIKAPFTFDGTGVSGSMFAIYTVKYTYPFLGIRLNR